MRRSYFRPKFLLSSLVILLIIISILIGLRSWYNHNLGPVSSSKQTVYFTVDSGSSVHEIAVNLKNEDLIRNARAFETYVKGMRYHTLLQAGTYALNQSMSTPQIVDKMVKGEVSRDLITILPGKTLKHIRQVFKQAGYSETEIKEAFNPATYAGHPLFANLQTVASLEGLLYPDSFQKESATPAKTIVRESLDLMYKHLNSSIIRGFAAQGLSTYQGLTMASIVYQESGDEISEPTIAQVFLLRYKLGMALGSDVTAFYAAELADAGKTLGVDSPYNTRLHTGLPPGPIGTFTDIALKAVANPNHTDYLYFVAGDDGTIHFSHTQAEHEDAIRRYCHKECS